MRMTLFFFYMNRDVIFFFPHFRDVETSVQVFDVKKKKKKSCFHDKSFSKKQLFECRTQLSQFERNEIIKKKKKIEREKEVSIKIPSGTNAHDAIHF